jgi:hypothetical protein
LPGLSKFRRGLEVRMMDKRVGYGNSCRGIDKMDKYKKEYKTHLDLCCCSVNVSENCLPTYLDLKIIGTLKRRVLLNTPGSIAVLEVETTTENASQIFTVDETVVKVPMELNREACCCLASQDTP